MSTDETANRVAQGLAKVGLAMRHEAWREAGPRGLTPTQAQVLTTLRAHRAAAEPLGVNDVARALAVTAATTSDALRVLVEKGLVEKTKAGRSVQLQLTDEGSKLADELAGWPDFLSEALSGLEPEERAVMLRSLMKTIRSLQEQGRIPVARMCVSCRYFRPHVYDDAKQPHHCAFVDAPFGDDTLQIDCSDYDEASLAQQTALRHAFDKKKPVATDAAGDEPSIDERSNA